MSRRLTILLYSTWLTVPGLALAGEIPPEQLARIRRDEKAAVERVNAAYGNKKSSELSTAERRQMIREQQEAHREVMNKHGVSEKDYARQLARMGPKQNARLAAEEKTLEEKAAKGGEKEPGEIQIQYGLSENPVELESAPAVVEHGLPTEETAPVEEGTPVEEGQPEGEPVQAEGQ